MDKALDKSFTMNRPFRYILLFITRSFLISILFFVIIITMFLMYYLFDMFIHSGSSNTPPLYSTYMIVSPSMVPTINVNDAIVVKRIDHDNYKVGDIITFSSIDDNYKGLMITHRIVDNLLRKKNPSIQLKEMEIIKLILQKLQQNLFMVEYYLKFLKLDI